MATKRLNNTELAKTLDEYTKEFKAIVNIKPKQFDTARIATMISALPERKWNAAQAVILNTIAKKDADQKLKTAKAIELLSATKNKESSGLTDIASRQAHVDRQDNIQMLEIDTINAEAELLAAKLAFDCLDDLYNAGKKIMEWLVEQDRQTRAYVNYVDEGRKNK